MNLTLLLPLLLLSPGQDRAPLAADDNPAQDYWERVADELAERRSVRQVLALDPATQQMTEAVRTTRLASLEVVEQESLTAVIEVLQAMTGLPILVDSEAEDRVLDEGLVFSLNWTHPTSIETTLDVLCDMADGIVDWTVREGAVLVTVPERAFEPKIYLHPIADLTTIFDADHVAYLIMDNVQQGSWDMGGVAIEITGAFLTVIHSRGVQVEIEAFLQDLRAFADTLGSAPDFSEQARQPELEAAYGRLEAVRLSPSFAEAPIQDVAAFLQELTGMNALVSRRVFEELDEEETTLTLTLPQTDVRTLLDLIVELKPNLAWSVAGGVLHIQTAEEARPGQTLAFYDVRTIVGPAPPECIIPSDFGRGDEVYENLVIGADYLEQLVRNAIAPESWDMNPENSLVITESGILIVNQSYAVQDRVRELLGDLQAIGDVMLEAREPRRK